MRHGDCVVHASARAAQGELIERTLAIVGGQAITLSDVRAARWRSAWSSASGRGPVPAATKRLIDRAADAPRSAAVCAARAARRRRSSASATRARAVRRRPTRSRGARRRRLHRSAPARVAPRRSADCGLSRSAICRRGTPTDEDVAASSLTRRGVRRTARRQQAAPADLVKRLTRNAHRADCRLVRICGGGHRRRAGGTRAV